jgi:DNA topoisomerase I
VALPRSMKPVDVDLETALRLLALPRELGRHPETSEPIIAGIGRFGAYIKHGNVFKSLGGDDDVLTIGLNRAVVLLAEPSSTGRRGPLLLRELGAHPKGGAVGLYRGRYGPYVSHDGIIASLPRNADPETFSLEQALPLLAAQRDKGRGRRRNARKAAAAKATTRNSDRVTTPAGKAAATKTRRTDAAGKAASRPATTKPRGRPANPSQ